MKIFDFESIFGYVFLKSAPGARVFNAIDIYFLGNRWQNVEKGLQMFNFGTIPGYAFSKVRVCGYATRYNFSEIDAKG